MIRQKAGLLGILVTYISQSEWQSRVSVHAAKSNQSARRRGPQCATCEPHLRRSVYGGDTRAPGERRHPGPGTARDRDGAPGSPGREAPGWSSRKETRRRPAPPGSRRRPGGPAAPHTDSGAAKSARGANGESAARSWPADQGTTETPPFTLDFKQSIQE